MIADNENVIELGWYPADGLHLEEVLKTPHRDPKDKWWTMHYEYHDDVSRCLEESELHYTFNEADSREAYLLNEWNTVIPGFFVCHNKNVVPTGVKAPVVKLHCGARHGTRKDVI